MSFAPAATVPLTAVGGLPVGVRVTGQRLEDAGGGAVARWLLDAVETVAA